MHHRLFRSFILLLLFACLLSSQAVQKINQMPNLIAEDTTITSVVQASQDDAIQVTSPTVPMPKDALFLTKAPFVKEDVILYFLEDFFPDKGLYATDTHRMVEWMKYHSNYLSLHVS
ncbi:MULTISPECIES: hypothetical protein [Virgibacillus]|uniref:Uncharacterized protein n=1 Tax=Virgibacillus dokdonensis TaxID=302167 RepID=A0A2K9IXW6_9BACI|nr:MULTISPECIES: hypothetical protein [Virgibacillus]AUJ24274.1 hypothetical protein A21D_01175 [Virgibacillus dokdonensis]NWO12655.1 hypothetical protein [Virgibacillus sp.]